MAGKGWISIHRQIEDSAIWNVKEPFDKRSAWIDLILMANHEDREIFVNGCPLVVHRGQKFTSVRHLADKWMWSYGKTSRFIKSLIMAGMVSQDGTCNGSLITIENYDKFQCDWITKRITDGSAGESHPNHRRYTNNNVNNVNNENNGNIEPPARLNPEGDEYE